MKHIRQGAGRRNQDSYSVVLPNKDLWNGSAAILTTEDRFNVALPNKDLWNGSAAIPATGIGKYEIEQL